MKFDGLNQNIFINTVLVIETMYESLPIKMLVSTIATRNGL